MPRRQVLDAKRVLAEARRVHGVSQVVAVVADDECVHREVGVIAREHVQVEDDFLERGQRAELAREDRVLFSLLRARVVPVTTLAIGDREVGLLDPREHLFVEAFLEGAGTLKRRFGVGVLGREMRCDPRVVLVAHPEVVVLDRLAMERDGMRTTRGDGRCHSDMIPKRGHSLFAKEDTPFRITRARRRC